MHPIVTGNYRSATPAIQAFYELAIRCLRYRTTGALIYGPSRIGKTRGIGYLRLLLGATHHRITTYHVQAEHKPRHAEGPSFTNLLDAVGYPEPDTRSNQSKRIRLINKLREACSKKNGSGIAIMFVDEAQRLAEKEYEWLRDVQDQLDRMQIKLFMFLVGQHELYAIKVNMQRAGRTQIVARLMVDELAFLGIRNAGDLATCLGGYGETTFPQGTDWTFTRFYLPQATDNGYEMSQDAQILRDEFATIHNKACLGSKLDILMESFTWAVEIMLKECELQDRSDFRPPVEVWRYAVEISATSRHAWQPHVLC